MKDRWIVANRNGVGGVMERHVGVSRCKVSVSGWINNKVLLYSTENLIQWPVINHNGKEYKRKNVCNNEIFLRHKKEQNNAISSSMDGPRDCHTE